MSRAHETAADEMMSLHALAGSGRLRYRPHLPAQSSNSAAATWSLPLLQLIITCALMLAGHVSAASSLPADDRPRHYIRPMLMMQIMRFSLHTWAVLIASVFLLLTLYLSFSLIFAHLTNYSNPGEQKWLLGVVFMVPIYSVESFASLWNSSISIECDILRNCYEAFALYSFGNYLIACLGGEEKILESFQKKALASSMDSGNEAEGADTAVYHPFPLKLLVEPWPYGEDIYRTIKFGIVQYMIIKTVCALLALLLELFNSYGDGEFDWSNGYPYITMVLNFSQMWALYCLVQFYKITHEELKHIRPLAKFLCFKAIVFATWWQGVIIAALYAVKVIPRSISGIPKPQASLQDFIIGIEMAIAALAHRFVFSASPYVASLNYFSQRKLSISPSSDMHKPFLEIDQVQECVTGSCSRVADADVKASSTSLKDSVQDVVLGGGETVVQDVKITVTQAVEPVEKGITALNEILQPFPWTMMKADKTVETSNVDIQDVEQEEREIDDHSSCVEECQEKPITS